MREQKNGNGRFFHMNALDGPLNHIEKIRRVGMLIPSTDTTIEKEMRAFLPKTVDVHFARMPLKAVTENELEEMASHALGAAALIADIKPDIVVYGCTSGTFIKGMDYDKALKKQLQEITGTQVITIASAVIDLLSKTPISNLCVFAPYSRSISEKLVRFIEKHVDIRVDNVNYMDIVDDTKTGEISADVIKNFVCSRQSLKTNGVFISCSNSQVLERLHELWSIINKPLVSSNLAVLWAIYNHFSLEPEPELFKCCFKKPVPKAKAETSNVVVDDGMIVRSLESLLGTDRDVSWGNGKSRRFLIQRDIFPFSLTDTIVFAGTTSRLRYENHIEACYCISGEGEIVTNGKRLPIRPGVMYAVKHNEHFLTAFTEMRLLCVFTPPLDGNEKHNLKFDSYSSY
jgi:maleate cis-trans isomerase